MVLWDGQGQGGLKEGFQDELVARGCMGLYSSFRGGGRGGAFNPVSWKDFFWRNGVLL